MLNGFLEWFLATSSTVSGAHEPSANLGGWPAESGIILSAALAVFEFIEGFYNPRRRHTSIGSVSLTEFEQRMSQAA